VDVRRHEVTPEQLMIGRIYYMLQYQGSANSAPIVTSYEYKGPVDGKPHLHFFKALGLSDANVFLEGSSLSGIVDVHGLKLSLQQIDHAS
jgi:hypothetical protein